MFQNTIQQSSLPAIPLMNETLHRSGHTRIANAQCLVAYAFSLVFQGILHWKNQFHVFSNGIVIIAWNNINVWLSKNTIGTGDQTIRIQIIKQWSPNIEYLPIFHSLVKSEQIFLLAHRLKFSTDCTDIYIFKVLHRNTNRTIIQDAVRIQNTYKLILCIAEANI